MENIETLPDDIEIEKGKSTPKYVPFDTLLALKKKYPRISQRHLGKMVGLSNQAVAQAFQRHNVDWETGDPLGIEEHKKIRADILVSKQIQCLHALSGKKLKEAPAAALATVYGILYDKEQKERGNDRSDAPAAVFNLIQVLSDNSRSLLPGQTVTIEAAKE